MAGQGKVEEAIKHFRRQVEIKPDYVGAKQTWYRAKAMKGGKYGTECVRI